MNAWGNRFTCGLLLAVILWGLQSPVGLSSPEASMDLEGVTKVVSTTLTSGVQQVVVMDTSTQSMAVYHIDPTYGKISLKSARSIRWDLQLEHFNGQSPLPAELRDAHR